MLRVTSLLLLLSTVLLSGCSINYIKTKPQPLGRHLTITPKEAAELTDREFLMRKATLGSRGERMEALDVIERSNDPELFTFLLERLKKEDDDFLRIRIMQVLGKAGDVRAVPILRGLARWDDSRVGAEAIAALYELGDDSLLPRLIWRLRPDEESPEMPGIAHRILQRMTGVDLPPTYRSWMSYYNSHRIAPYESRAWYLPFRAPLPPTVEGTTQVVQRPKAGSLLPTENVRVRRTNVTWRDFWKTEAP